MAEALNYKVEVVPERRGVFNASLVAWPIDDRLRRAVMALIEDGTFKTPTVILGGVGWVPFSLGRIASRLEGIGGDSQAVCGILVEVIREKMRELDQPKTDPDEA